MHMDQNNSERLINRLLDAELTPDAEHELNRTLIREPVMMRLREDYQKLDVLAGQALATLRNGAEVDLDAVFEAVPIAKRTVRMGAHRGWLMIPGAIAAALLAMVIPDPDYRGGSSVPLVTNSDLYPIAQNVPWSGSNLARPVSTAPTIRSQTGRDVIGVVGDDGNLYWIEVEKKRTVRWPAGSPSTPDASDSM